MNEKLPFREISTYPNAINGVGVITRMLDGLGFRFYWATEGLTERDYAYRFSKDGMSVEEIVIHILALVNWIGLALKQDIIPQPSDISLVRNAILEKISDLRIAFSEMNEEELTEITLEEKPFWHLINGPIADAISHVGQVNILRRANGNPPLRCNFFLSIPPDMEKS